MIVKCLYNDPENLPEESIPFFDYGLEKGKEYLVMGLGTFKRKDDIYCLIDENGRPSWFPLSIFEMIDSTLPADWIIKTNYDRVDIDFRELIGFRELCSNPDFFNGLLLREQKALKIYFGKKTELENIAV